MAKALWKKGDTLIVPDVPVAEQVEVYGGIKKVSYGKSPHHSVGEKIEVRNSSWSFSLQETTYFTINKSGFWQYRESDLLKSNDGHTGFQPKLL